MTVLLPVNSETMESIKEVLSYFISTLCEKIYKSSEHSYHFESCPRQPELSLSSAYRRDSMETTLDSLPQLLLEIENIEGLR